MNKEIWRDIVGYEGLYQVSNLGRVKSLKRKVYAGRNISDCLNGKQNHSAGYKWKYAEV